MNIKRNTLVVIFFAFLLNAFVINPVFAEMRATPLSGDTRLVTFEYDAENTYLVLTKPKAHTHVMMPEGEVIETVIAGDTHNWDIITTNNMRHVFLKPKHDDIQTTLTVITSRRTYQLVIRSTGEGRKWYQQVAWEMPKGFFVDKSTLNVATNSVPVNSKDERETLTLNPRALNFNYKVDGNEQFKPIQAFDDGKRVWLKMPQNLVELPGVFGKEGRDLILVNYIVDGEYIVVQQLIDKVILKINKREVQVMRSGSRQ